MMKFSTRFPTLVLALGATALLSGCATGPKPIYQWGSYQAQVYEHFKGKTAPEEQIKALEGDLQKMQATRKICSHPR